VQLVCTLGLAGALRFIPASMDALEVAFPAQSPQAAVLFFIMCITLPAVSLVKDKHPWNLAAMAGWSVILALFIAVSDLPGAYFNSHALFVIMIELTAGVFFLLLFTQVRFGDALITITFSGILSYLCWIFGAGLIFGYLQSNELEGITVGHFVVATLASTVMFAWITYDMYKLVCKMSPDEYMKGVIHFYTDMFYMCVCCCIVACIGGAVRGGAPPSKEESR